MRLADCALWYCFLSPRVEQAAVGLLDFLERLGVDVGQHLGKRDDGEEREGHSEDHGVHQEAPDVEALALLKIVRLARGLELERVFQGLAPHTHGVGLDQPRLPDADLDLQSRPDAHIVKDLEQVNPRRDLVPARPDARGASQRVSMPHCTSVGNVQMLSQDEAAILARDTSVWGALKMQLDGALGFACAAEGAGQSSHSS